MRIKTILRISATVSIGLSLILGFAFFVISQQINKTIEKDREAGKIIEAVFNLNVINSDYLLHHEKRAKSQWYIKHTSLEKLLHKLSVTITDPKGQVVLDSMRQDHNEIKVIFSKLVTSIERQESGIKESTVFQELKERLVTQVSLKSQAMVFDTQKLAEYSQAEIMNVQQNANLLIMLLIAMTTTIMVLNSFLLNKRIVKPIAKLQEGTEIISTGKLDYEISSTAKDEIGLLANSFGEMLESLRNVVRQANTIAKGDYSIEIKPRSEQDTLGIALEQMHASLKNMVELANTIATGDYTADISPSSEKDELAIAMQKMTRTLRETSKVAEGVAAGNLDLAVKEKGERDLLAKSINSMISSIKKQDWLKTGQSQLNDKMRGDQDLVKLAQKILNYLAAFLDVQIGLFYLKEGELFKLVCSYAYQPRKGYDNEFKLGEGLVGQAALEKKGILFAQVPEDHVHVTIASGMGESTPRSILVLPLIHEGNSIGVLEFGTSRDFTDMEMELLNQVAENIAININSARSRLCMSELLEETQSQAEELQAQHDELFAAKNRAEEATRGITEIDA